MRRAVLAFTALALLALPTAAHAGLPVTVGRGGEPSIAVDDRGAAHVAWNADVGGTTQTDYCRVPRGTEGCAASDAFPPPAGQRTYDRPLVLVTPDQRLLVLRRTCCGPDQVLLRASGDRGGSFAPDAVLATDAGAGAQPPAALSGDALYLPDVDGVVWTDGISVQGAPLAGAATRRPATLFGPVSQGGAIDLYFGNISAFSEDGAGRILWRTYDGTGSIIDATNWTPAVEVATSGAGRYELRAAGDSRIFFRDRSNLMIVRPDAGSEPVFPISGPYDAWGDPSGRTHFAWAPPGSGTILWRTADGSQTVTIVRGAQSITSLRGGATADGRGWVAYRTIDGLVHVVALEAAPVPPEPTPPGPTPPTPTPPGAAPRFHPALAVHGAWIRRGRLHLRARLTREADGERVTVRLRAAGRRSHFTTRVRRGRIRLDERLPRSQRHARRGRYRLAYAGNDRVLAARVRLLAAPRRARLRLRRAALRDGRLRLAGRIARRARGRVRLTLDHVAADGSTSTWRGRARIRRGRFQRSVRVAAPLSAGGLLTVRYVGRHGRRGEQVTEVIAPS